MFKTLCHEKIISGCAVLGRKQTGVHEGGGPGGGDAAWPDVGRSLEGQGQSGLKNCW